MTVTITLHKKEYLIEGNITVKQALQKLNLSTETHMILRNGELLTEKELIKDGDVVKLIAIISGGSE